MGPRAGLDILERDKKNSCPRRDSNAGPSSHSIVTISTIPALPFFQGIFRISVQRMKIYEIYTQAVKSESKALQLMSVESFSTLLSRFLTNNIHT